MTERLFVYKDKYSHKWWKVSIVKTHKNTYNVISSWGPAPVNMGGTSKALETNVSSSYANTFAAKKIAEKINKGYKEVTLEPVKEVKQEEKIERSEWDIF